MTAREPRAAGVKRMFKSLRLRNFKSYEDSQPVPLAPLTIIIGVNNSGKSTLLNAILAIKQASQETGRPGFVSKGLVDLNGFYDILHHKARETTNPSFSMSLTLDETPYLYHHPAPDSEPEKMEIADSLEVSYCLGKETNEIELEKLRFGAAGKTAFEFRSGAPEWTSDTLPTTISRRLPVQLRGLMPRMSIKDFSGEQVFSAEVFEAMNVVAFHGAYWTQFLLDRVDRIEPLRTRVPWSASIGTKAPAGYSSGGANLLAALGNDRAAGETKKTLLELVNEWIAKFRLLRSLHLETDSTGTNRMLLADEINGPANINVAGMGEGISQILPIIAGTVALESRRCLLVEQPEIHLHPQAQADLADLFVHAATLGRRQVLVETHSEHIVLRVRRRIAEGLIRPEEVAILFVEKPGHASTVRRLNLNSRGHFSDWPEGFFDEAYKDAMAMVDASLEKRA